MKPSEYIKNIVAKEVLTYEWRDVLKELDKKFIDKAENLFAKNVHEKQLKESEEIAKKFGIRIQELLETTIPKAEVLKIIDEEIGYNRNEHSRKTLEELKKKVENGKT